MEGDQFLQFGAMGLLGFALVWGLRYAIPKTVETLASSVQQLAGELKALRTTQTEFSKLLALLLAREYGPRKAAEVLREVESHREDKNDLQHGSREGRDQG